jgi:hypothetical protein
MGRLRLVSVAAVCVVSAGLAGCGGSNNSPRAVQVSLLAPTDGATVIVPKIDVLGNVAPGNGVVFVAGRRVRVVNGLFKSAVHLRRGTTRIRVEARAGGYVRTVTWVKVRYRPVRGVRPPSSGGGTSASGLSVALRLLGITSSGRQPTAVEVEQDYIRGCTDTGGPSGYCHCTYQQLVAQGYNTVPKFLALSVEVRDALIRGGPSQLPRPAKKAVVACISRLLQ